MIGRIGSTSQEEVQVDGLPKVYWQYKELFGNEKGQMLAARRTFDHAIDLKDGATPPRRPIYPMSAYQLEELNKYLHQMLSEGIIVHRKIFGGRSNPLCPKTRRKTTIMRRLLSTKQVNHTQQIAVTAHDRTKVESCRCDDFHQTRPKRRLPFD